jgi:replicative superfamily II helicase
VVDFTKRLAGKRPGKILDPLGIYDSLDRAHDKGPLRPAQLSILQDWFQHRQAERDVIVKLHTGQGKTLVGLLMLQSRLNAGEGPAVYLCPDHFLIDQTCEQAKQFGISTCTADADLPDTFLNSEKILVTSVHKVFNGLSRFGLNRKSISVGTLLMDDAHACSDIVREACGIRIPSTEPAYDALLALFSTELEQQGVGTYADICNDKRDAFLPVPYWAWLAHEGDVAKILSGNVDRQSIKFAWPLLKDMLAQCQCVISGTAVEIEPYIPPLNSFGSYWNAGHRIFMSATVTDDAFLVKGLQLAPDTIIGPLTYPNESWSGEKMVLLPSLIHEELTRDWIVSGFGKPGAKRRIGIVVLARGFAWTKDWEAYGSIVATKDTVTDVIGRLRGGKYDQTVVLVNRYDGIDLPDDTCRLLIVDGKPFSENLIDVYQEFCRPNSESTLMRTIRTIEQGMGRSVRGEKDFSVIVVVGSDIVKLIRDRRSRQLLSPQMSKQIGIGLEIAEMARQEIEAGTPPPQAFNSLLRQCLNRDEDWKAFYVEQMQAVKPTGANAQLLNTYAAELEAETANCSGDYATATAKLQDFVNQSGVSAEDRAWYLQDMARYQYKANRTESNVLQIAAHKANRLLLKPASGVTVAKLSLVSHGRVERILAWMGKFDSYSDLDVGLSDVLSRLVFGVKADKFEHALDEISVALGFAGERPDKEWKEGPDNLWALDATQYILWECKSEVEVTRAEILKRETEQMNRSSAWFAKHYPGSKAKRIMVHPSLVVPSAAAFTDEVFVMRENELKEFVSHIRSFFKSFESSNFKDLSALHIQQLVDAHALSVADLLVKYSRKPKNLR